MADAYKELLKSSGITGQNLEYLTELYEDYLYDANSVSNEWHAYFESITDRTQKSHKQTIEYFKKLKSKPTSSEYSAGNDHADYIKYGHLLSKLDPLDLSNNEVPKPIKDKLNSEKLDKVFCQSIGFEIDHVDTHEQEWILGQIQNDTQFTTEDRLTYLKSLLKAELFENMLNNKFVGQKRFSLEGCDSLIPLLECVIRSSHEQNTSELVIGMAHRGRLNVMANVMGMSVEKIISLFENKKGDTEYSGDVKYHLGCSCDRLFGSDRLHVSLLYNPSHLEAVTPVVMGGIRARLDRDDSRNSMGIIIHGDSAICGQGVVYESINMSYTPAYHINGCLHIVTNNQIGFSTEPHDYRSTQYSTEIAKVISAPVFHVNASDLDAVIKVAKLATMYRNQFNKDVFIDLIGYRKYGHNEADEPSATQPLMYQKIRSFKPYSTLYIEKLTHEGVSIHDLNTVVSDIKKLIGSSGTLVDHCQKHHSERARLWSSYVSNSDNGSIETGIKKKVLTLLADKVNFLPEKFTLQKQIKAMHQDRLKMSNDSIPINWGFAEMMAYASLLEDGYKVRITGQDCLRGTFFHRHATYFDHSTGESFTPLKQSYGKDFEIYNSVLSEYAALGFEYGYSESYPDSLVIWEAQFGDFSNGAQIIIDQFISSSWQKWQRMSGLVMLLPHGYEGQGPEHSSARLERYLQLCAQNNMCICNPTTPAQIFHLLRRQMLQKTRRPLVVMSPKSLLRHPKATSELNDLTNTTFQEILLNHKKPSKTYKKIVLCSGKIYYDLINQVEKMNTGNDYLIIRIEQLYPFPRNELQKIFNQTKSSQFIWCQEEPFNQGAWLMIRHEIEQLLPNESTLNFVGRESSASPACGYYQRHASEQDQIIQSIFNC